MGIKFFISKKYIAFNFLVLFLITYYSGMNNYDMKLFSDWGRGFLAYSPSQYYDNVHADYSPVYIWLLGFCAWLEKIFTLKGQNSIGFIFRLFPLVSIYINYYLVKRIFEIICPTENVEFPRMFLLWNPAIIYITAVWGQADYVLISFFLVCILGALKKNTALMLVSAFIGVLFKPQMIFLAPLIGLLVLYDLKFKKVILSTVLALVIGYLLCLPFIWDSGLIWFKNYYSAKSGQFKLTSLAAGTLMGLIGGDHRSDHRLFLGIEIRYFSILCLMIFYTWLTFLYSRLKEKIDYNKRVIVIAALSTFGTYFLMSRMHSRYLIYSLVPIQLLLSLSIFKMRESWCLSWGLSFVLLWQCLTHYPINFLSIESTIVNHWVPYRVTHLIICLYQLWVFGLLVFKTYQISKVKTVTR